LLFLTSVAYWCELMSCIMDKTVNNNTNTTDTNTTDTNTTDTNTNDEYTTDDIDTWLINSIEDNEITSFDKYIQEIQVISSEVSLAASTSNNWYFDVRIGMLIKHNTIGPNLQLRQHVKNGDILAVKSIIELQTETDDELIGIALQNLKDKTLIDMLRVLIRYGSIARSTGHIENNAITLAIATNIIDVVKIILMSNPKQYSMNVHRWGGEIFLYHVIKFHCSSEMFGYILSLSEVLRHHRDQLVEMMLKELPMRYYVVEYIKRRYPMTESLIRGVLAFGSCGLDIWWLILEALPDKLDLVWPNNMPSPVDLCCSVFSGRKDQELRLKYVEIALARGFNQHQYLCVERALINDIKFIKLWLDYDMSIGPYVIRLAFHLMRKEALIVMLQHGVDLDPYFDEYRRHRRKSVKSTKMMLMIDELIQLKK
jgi:hypothetical protein